MGESAQEEGMNSARWQLMYTAVLYFFLGFLEGKHAPTWQAFFIGAALIIAWRFTSAFVFKPRYKSSTGV